MYMQSLKIALVGHKIALTHATFWRLTYNTPSVVFKGSGIIQVNEKKIFTLNIILGFVIKLELYILCTWTLNKCRGTLQQNLEILFQVNLPDI